MDLYKEEVMDHYEHPRNQGEINPSAGSGQIMEGRDSNASCGDMVQFQLRIVSDSAGQRISEVKWKGIGCAVTTAAASKLSEWLIDKKVAEIKKMDEEQLIKEAIGFEVNPGRIKCLTLPVRLIVKVISKTYV